MGWNTVGFKLQPVGSDLMPVSGGSGWGGWEDGSCSASRGGLCCLMRLYIQRYQYRMSRQRKAKRATGIAMPIASFFLGESPLDVLPSEFGMIVE